MIFHSQKLCPDDVALIQEVGRATYEPYYPHIWLPGGLDWYMERCFGAESLAPELSDPNCEYHVPRDENGAIIGLLKLVLHKPTPDRSVQNALYLEKIYLMPDFYGRGWGQQLMQYVFERAAALGREAVWLVCMENGPLWAYERAGFVKTGTVHWDFELLKDAERTGFVMLRTIP